MLPHPIHMPHPAGLHGRCPRSLDRLRRGATGFGLMLSTLPQRRDACGRQDGAIQARTRDAAAEPGGPETPGGRIGTRAMGLQFFFSDTDKQARRPDTEEAIVPPNHLPSRGAAPADYLVSVSEEKGRRRSVRGLFAATWLPRARPRPLIARLRGLHARTGMDLAACCTTPIVRRREGRCAGREPLCRAPSSPPFRPTASPGSRRRGRRVEEDGPGPKQTPRWRALHRLAWLGLRCMDAISKGWWPD